MTSIRTTAQARSLFRKYRKLQQRLQGLTEDRNELKRRLTCLSRYERRLVMAGMVSLGSLVSSDLLAQGVCIDNGEFLVNTVTEENQGNPATCH